MTRTELRELLTAAIDGELTTAQAAEVKRVLRGSAEARALHAKLTRDSGRVRNLKRHAAPAELIDNVLGSIRERSLVPTPLPPARRSTERDARRIRWASMATAAGILIALGTGSFLYFSDRPDSQRMSTIVTRKPAESKATPPESGPMPHESHVDVAILPPAKPELGPSPRVVEMPFVGPPEVEVPRLRDIDLDAFRVSKLFVPRDLPGTEAEQKKLIAELKKDELIRLDLFATAIPKGTEVVLNALRARGIDVIIDAHAQERQKKHPATELMIFTEAMSPDEVAAFVVALGAEDKRWPSAVFEALIVAPFLPKDLTQLGKLLGLPVTPAKEKVDLSKPLPEGTANQIASTLRKMGNSTSAPTPKANNLAVLVTYSSTGSYPAASKEVKQFLDRRSDRKAEAKPLKLLIRSN